MGGPTKASAAKTAALVKAPTNGNLTRADPRRLDAQLLDVVEGRAGVGNGHAKSHIERAQLQPGASVRGNQHAAECSGLSTQTVASA